MLPRNDEWEYASSFISMSDVLDDEQREAFLQSLQELQEIKEHEVQAEATTLQQEKDAQLHGGNEDKNGTEADKAASRKRKPGQSGSIHRRTSSEVDYGIEKKPLSGDAFPTVDKLGSAPLSNAASAAVLGRSQLPPSANGSRSRNMRRSPPKRPATYVQHLRNRFRLLQDLLRNIVTSFGANPTRLLKMLVSVLAIIMALSRRDIRERAKRILGGGWDKVRNTVGMGVKVSYI